MSEEKLRIYQSADCRTYFMLQLIKKRDYYEIDLVSMTPYLRRNSGAVIAHRLYSDTPNREKICISAGHEPKDEETAWEIAKGWCDLTWNYIKTGETIDNQVSKGQSKSIGQGRFVLPSYLYGQKLSIYRTKDGKAYFIYQIISKEHFFEIDIVSLPLYRGRNNSAYIAHKIASETSFREKICISDDHKPKDIETAISIASEWAELTWEYIKTGKPITSQIHQTEDQNVSHTGNSNLKYKILAAIALILTIILIRTL